MNSFSPIFAIALNSFQESVRSKVFLICLFILGGLCLMAPLLPSVNEPTLKLKLVLSVSTSICYIFGLIILIFTSSTLISDDVNSRRIFTIFSKPVSRLSYLCGKLLGISYLALSLMVILAIIVIFFVRFTYFTFSSEEQTKSATFFQMIESKAVDKIQHYQFDKESKRNRPATRFTIEYKDVIAKGLTGSMTIRILAYFRGQKNIAHDGTVYFNIDVVDIENDTVISKMKDIELKDSEYRTFKLDKNLFTYEGQKDLRFEFTIADQSRQTVAGLFIKKESILLRKPSSSFELNVFKSFILLAAQFILLGFICIMGSTRLSSFVAIMLAVTLFIAGYFSNFLRNEIDKHAKFRNLPNYVSITYLDKVGDVSDRFVSTIIYLAPDFGKYSLKSELLDGFAIKNSQIIEIILLYMIYFFGYMIVALLFFWRREFT